MANPQLTVKQFAVLALGQASPPWHLGNLLKGSGRQSFSLRDSISALSAAQAVVYVRVGDFGRFLQSWIKAVDGDFEGLPAGSTPAEIWGNYLQQTLSVGGPPVGTNDPVGTLVKLSNILSGVGGSVVYVNEDYTTVGIAATFVALANSNAAAVPVTPPSTVAWIDSGLAGGGAWAGPDFEAPNLVLLGPLTGQDGGMAVLSASAFTALSPAAVSGVPLGLLWIYINNKNNTPAAGEVDATQLLANHLQVTRDTMVSLLLHTISTSATDIAAAIQDLDTYTGWLDYLKTITSVNAGALPAGAELSLGGSGNLTIPQITLQPADTSQPPIVISEFTLQPDGTSTGGTVSQ